MGKMAVAALILVCTGMMVLTPAIGAQQNMDQRPALQQTMADRYRLTRVGTTALSKRGAPDRVRRAGGVVIIRKAGLYGGLEHNDAASVYIREGEPPKLYAGKKEHEIRVGEKFYVHSVAVADDVVVLGLVSVASISTATRPGQLWLTLNFFFPKPVLEHGDITTVYRTLDQWLLPEGSFQPGYSETAATAATPSRTVPATPSDLRPGMDREQVVASLGAPLKEASFGTKTWLTYPGMVVVLEQGKLASVDQTSQPPAKVSVGSEPSGADVYVDGNFVGSTPSLLPLPPGSYKIEVKAAGFKNWSREIKTLAGGEVNLKATLEKVDH
ncbi:MAG TPA: PEGA domain-containing protein [Terriglobales bacterium]|nr:PEGA domain-containing protein [Terriglobales bacterium]